MKTKKNNISSMTTEELFKRLDTLPYDKDHYETWRELIKELKARTGKDIKE